MQFFRGPAFHLCLFSEIFPFFSEFARDFFTFPPLIFFPITLFCVRTCFGVLFPPFVKASRFNYCVGFSLFFLLSSVIRSFVHSSLGIMGRFYMVRALYVTTYVRSYTRYRLLIPNYCNLKPRIYVFHDVTTTYLSDDNYIRVQPIHRNHSLPMKLLHKFAYMSSFSVQRGRECHSY